MKQALLVVDVQPSFPVPIEIVQGIRELSTVLPSIATVERHDESITPFERQLGWKPGKSDDSLVVTDRTFIRHGYLPPAAAIDYLRDLQVDRVLVCGVQEDTCGPRRGLCVVRCGLHPTLLKWLTVARRRCKPLRSNGVRFPQSLSRSGSSNRQIPFFLYVVLRHAARSRVQQSALTWSAGLAVTTNRGGIRHTPEMQVQIREEYDVRR
jgi:hypothetical protein